MNGEIVILQQDPGCRPQVIKMGQRRIILDYYPGYFPHVGLTWTMLIHHCFNTRSDFIGQDMISQISR